MSGEDFVVRLRGLPWSAGRDDVIKFLDGVMVEQVHFWEHDGRPSGEAFVELTTSGDVTKALEKNQQYMGRRYIEVFESSLREMNFKIKTLNNMSRYDDNEDAVVHLRGLPFEATRDMLLDFFDGFPVTPNGISILMDNYGRATGEAFIQFATQELADKALLKHKERMGHRYIEVFKSSLHEARDAISASNRNSSHMRPGPYDRQRNGGGGGGFRGPSRLKGYMGGYNDYTVDYDEDYHSRRPQQPRRGGMGRTLNDDYVSQTGFFVHMRGLPFNANEEDVLNFFSPIIPTNVSINFGDDGRPAGEADVDFASKTDAQNAMKKDRERMQHRYIELFMGRSGKVGGYGDNYKSF